MFGYVLAKGKRALIRKVCLISKWGGNNRQIVGKEGKIKSGGKGTLRTRVSKEKSYKRSVKGERKHEARRFI